MVQTPQFSVRLMLIMMGSCGLAFAGLTGNPPIYVALVAAMIPAFWVGAGCAFVGAALETRGDQWLVPAVLMGVFGMIICILAVFTGIFYTSMIALAEFGRLLQ